MLSQYLDIANAKEIGLLPNIADGLIELLGNTAISRSVALLLAEGRSPQLQEVTDRTLLVNLADCADFEPLYLDRLYLRPTGEE